VPQLAFPGGALIGCSAGFVNVPRIKGSHNAVKTGMMAAEAVFEAVGAGRQRDALTAYDDAYKASDVRKELNLVRNAKPLWTRFGTIIGVGLGGIDMWLTTLLGGFSPFGTLKHGKTDAASTEPASKHQPKLYPKPDGVLTFDKLSSVFLSNTNHEEDQPVHLRVADIGLQHASELGVFAGQMMDPGLKAIEVAYIGEVAKLNVKPMTAAALAGVLATQPAHARVTLEALQALGPLASGQAGLITAVLDARIADRPGRAQACRLAVLALDQDLARRAVVERL
jgi:hypothetical protein